LQRIAESASDRRVANVIESLISVLGVDLPNYDWSFREGRFVGFSGAGLGPRG
jgi:hypothetical protein